MSAFDYIVDQDGVATVAFDTPGKRVNVWTLATLDELEEVLAELTRRGDLTAIVFRSAKPDTFIAGADIDMARRGRLARGGSRTRAPRPSRVPARGRPLGPHRRRDPRRMRGRWARVRPGVLVPRGERRRLDASRLPRDPAGNPPRVGRNPARATA